MHYICIVKKSIMFVSIYLYILFCSNSGLQPQALNGLVSIDITGTASLILGSSVLSVRALSSVTNFQALFGL